MKGGTEPGETIVLEALRLVSERRDLGEDEAEALFGEVMAGRAAPPLVAALLAALKTKGECPAEILGAARAMRAAALPVPVPPGGLVDTCGTGGDRSGTFNISTAAAVLASAAGVRVAKHGNRAASSRCGSADVLEALGVAIDLGPAAAASCLASEGITFLFAPLYHPAMRHAIEARRAIRLRTVFNDLGPLTNPARVRRQVIGAADPRTFERLSAVVGGLGYEHCLIVHGLEGLDEASLAGPTRVAEWRRGELREWLVTPEELGLARRPLADLRGGDAARNAAAVRAALSGGGATRGKRQARSAAAAVVALNAGAAIYVAGLEATWGAGVGRALEALADGAAARKLEDWARASRAAREGARAGEREGRGRSAPGERAAGAVQAPADDQPAHGLSGRGPGGRTSG